jgi:hypothetical protein
MKYANFIPNQADLSHSYRFSNHPQTDLEWLMLYGDKIRMSFRVDEVQYSLSKPLPLCHLTCGCDMPMLGEIQT